MSSAYSRPSSQQPSRARETGRRRKTGGAVVDGQRERHADRKRGAQFSDGELERCSLPRQKKKKKRKKSELNL